MAPDVIVPSTNQVTGNLQQETRTPPIAFAFVGDPVGSGSVTSLSRPGRNITGFANIENSIGGKWLELFKEIAPRGTSRIYLQSERNAQCGFLPRGPGGRCSAGDEADRPSRSRRCGRHRTGRHGIRGRARWRSDCRASCRDAGKPKLIIELAARHRLPAVYGDRYFAESGGLLSFGNNTAALFGRAASYVN